MKLLRALLFLFLVSAGVVGGGAFQYRVAAAAGTSTAAAPLAAEDAGLQTRTFAEAYNLLLDHYVHPLDTPSMLRAGWDELGKEATTTKAATPGPAPTFSGDRAGDLEVMRAALTAYVG